MSVLQVASGRWVAQLSGRRTTKRHVGTFDTEAEARAAFEAALAALPPKPALPPQYIVEDRGYSSPCWVWQRATATNGYGTIVVKQPDGSREWKRAHRHFYEQAKGTVPEAHHLDHLCRVRGCVNPDHLEPVTHAENCRRGANAKLTARQVDLIRASDEPDVSLARRYGVTEGTVYNIRTWRSWKPDKRTADLAKAA